MTPLHANGARAGSWYEATSEAPGPYPPLAGEATADVAIVGAGFTGLAAALALAEAGVDVAVLEAHRVGFGASGRNGGQVASGQRHDQISLEAEYGAANARALWDLGEAAKAEVRRLIAAHAPDAGWRDGIAYVARREKGVAPLQTLADHMPRTYGYGGIEALDRQAARALVGSEVVEGGIVDWGSGHIHPLRFAYGLARAAVAAGARIYEGTEVTGRAGTILRAKNGALHAQRLLLATNGYIGALEPSVAARVLPINSFVAVTEPLPERPFEQDIAVADDRFVVSYWRMVEGNRLLFGGGESYGLRFPAEIGAKVRRPLAELYPALKDVAFDYAWGGTLGITWSRHPMFARVDEGVWSAGGYSGQGVALATLGGRIAAEAIIGETARFDVMAGLSTPTVRGGPLVRRALVPLAMRFYAMRDRLGV
ncbi:MAG: FAD-binding oxidoreductase [Paracoccaceae bacterium]|nr:FAD-binding oxidoreductase [Paracoccaceae bacterium]